jgi:hypothetical protein
MVQLGCGLTKGNGENYYAYNSELKQVLYTHDANELKDYIKDNRTYALTEI